MSERITLLGAALAASVVAATPAADVATPGASEEPMTASRSSSYGGVGVTRGDPG